MGAESLKAYILFVVPSNNSATFNDYFCCVHCSLYAFSAHCFNNIIVFGILEPATRESQVSHPRYLPFLFPRWSHPGYTLLTLRLGSRLDRSQGNKRHPGRNRQGQGLHTCRTLEEQTGRSKLSVGAKMTAGDLSFWGRQGVFWPA